MRSPVLQNVVQ